MRSMLAQALAITGLTVVSAPVLARPAGAPAPQGVTATDCRLLPADALAALPDPFSRWTMLDCLPSGQILRQRDGWVWRYPGSFTNQVMIPAWTAETSATLGGAGRVFSRAETSVTEGQEAQALEDRFRRDIASYPSAPASAGSGPAEQPPAAVYTLLTVNDLGEFLILHVVYRSDRDMWGVVCAPDCRPENIFMIYKQTD